MHLTLSQACTAATAAACCVSQALLKAQNNIKPFVGSNIRTAPLPFWFGSLAESSPHISCWSWLIDTCAHIVVAYGFKPAVTDHDRIHRITPTPKQPV
jgi:hypothetical protein